MDSISRLPLVDGHSSGLKKKDNEAITGSDGFPITAIPARMWRWFKQQSEREHHRDTRHRIGAHYPESTVHRNRDGGLDLGGYMGGEWGSLWQCFDFGHHQRRRAVHRASNDSKPC